MTKQSNIESMPYHGPGWALDLSERDEDGEVVVDGERYMVWAPQTEADVTGSTVNGRPRVPRDHWSACWQSADGEGGDFIKGGSAAEVLVIFPDRIATRFQGIIGVEAGVLR